MSGPGLGPTAGQTVGPFFHLGLHWPGGADLVAPDHPGAVLLRGRVLDGAGEAVPDALVELTQSDAGGRLAEGAGSIARTPDVFTGFGRCATDARGGWAFTTLRPGAVGGGTPFWVLTVFARGLLHRLWTRAYLPATDAAGADLLAADPLLAGLDAGRRASLLARVDGAGFAFDVRLQGAGETVFLTTSYPGRA